MKLKKVLLALGFSLALSASVFAADNMWQYNQYTSIDMNSAKLYYDMGRQVLSFNTVEKSGDTTDYCTYVYNIDDQTIQLKKMITQTKKHKYKSSFYPKRSKTVTLLSKPEPVWPRTCWKRSWKSRMLKSKPLAANGLPKCASSALRSFRV